MKIFIDSECKCHVSNDGTMREFDVPFFDGRCQTFIEGYRYVPEGETFQHDSGLIVYGGAVSPWKPHSKLEKAQLEYELAQYKAAFAEIETALGVTSE